MSLKVFHVIFITLSVVLAIGFGIWMLMAGPEHARIADVIAALLSFGVGVLLIVYEMRILKKFKSLKLPGLDSKKE
jgi:hypothetical protein